MSIKFIAIVLLMSASLLLLLLLPVSSVTKIEGFASSNPSTVAIGSILYTVSNCGNGELKVFSNEDNTECLIKVNPVSESITGKIKAVALYHKIVVWGKRKEDLINNGSIRRTNYTFILIDPKLCTRYAFSNLVDEVPSSYPDSLPEVMAHQDSFDIFFSSQRECSPCSYDVNGERILRQEQLKHEGSPGTPFYLREIGMKSKYIYLYNLDNGTAMVKSVDNNFKDMFYPPKMLVIDTTVNSLVINQGDGKSYVGVSYLLQNSPRRPYFLLFNEDLEALYLAHLPLLDYYSLMDTSIAIDSRGYAYVTLIQQSGSDTRNITHVVYAPNGRIMGNEVIYELQPKVDYDVQTFVDDKQHCLVVHQLSGTLETKIKCRLL